jgi:ribosomal protein S27E
MKNVTCRHCGETRPAIIAVEGCRCGEVEISLNFNAVTDLINSRSTSELRCSSCGSDIFELDVDAYLHENGWNVPGLKDKWWLSIACPDCNHETSFCHFGIEK